MVEHNLAKVGVASSNLVSRSKPLRVHHLTKLWLYAMAGWQSGYAAACKAVYAGSIPTLASNTQLLGTTGPNDARVAELVDARDLKSLEGNFVPVRVRPRVPLWKFTRYESKNHSFTHPLFSVLSAL